MKKTGNEIDYKIVFEKILGIALLISPDDPEFTIVDCSQELLNFVNREKSEVVGKSIFIAFPDNPNDKNVNGSKNLLHSLRIVSETHKEQLLELQRYDIQTPNGAFEENYWEVYNSPIINNEGQLLYIIQISKNVTARVISDKKEKTTRDNFEYFLNQSISPFAILTGKEFVFTFANASYIDLMNGRQLVGKSLKEAIPEITDQPFLSLLTQVLQTGIPHHFPEIEATAFFAGSTKPSTKYFNLSYTPYKNHFGVIEGVLASGYEVTEQVLLRKKEEKNILNHQAYQLFMEAPVGFALVRGDDYVIELANITALKFSGKENEIIGKPVKEVFPELERQGYFEMLDTVKNTGKIISLKESPVTILLNGKMELFYLNLVYQPYFENNKIAGILTISTDVTEQVKARKRLEDAEQRARVAVESAEFGVYEVDLVSKILTGDKRFYELFGVPENIDWNRLIQSVHPDDVDKRNKAHEDSLKTGRLFYELRIIRADKTLHWIKVYGKLFYDAENEPVKLLGVAEDITDQKQLEQQKDNFISIASHELKTPVTTIKAYGQIAETMLQDKQNEKTLFIVKRMGEQVNKLTSLIEDLLDITKIEKGKLLYKESFFDFNELVEESVDDMQKTSGQHKINILPGDTANVFGDRDKLGQVLNNLISNAIKYSPNAKEIFISTKVEKGGIQLFIQDFGIGISEKEHLKIFEQFYRVNEGNMATYPGMGIGLYISSEIIKYHQGKIWVESMKDEGSTFYFWLPFDHRNKDDK